MLVPRMLSGQLLVLKEINAAKVTCRELLEYFKVGSGIRRVMRARGGGFTTSHSGSIQL